MNGPLLAAGPIYDRFRRGEDCVMAPGFELHRMQFESANSECQPPGWRGWQANERFVYPLFVPGPGPWQDVLIILNGLNDSSYRKFFPWAASIARAGVPVMIFPSSFLMNRRPREWIAPGATNHAWQTRLQVAPDSATPINAVLSQRVASDPSTLLQDALHTTADLQQLAATIRDGAFGGAPNFFVLGARSHLLGYSLGGYLALALKLQDALFSTSTVVTLCAGASTAGQEGERLDLVSPFILDRHATELLLSEVPSLQSAAAGLGPLASTLVELFTGTSAATRERIRGFTSGLTVLAGARDRTVPALGIEQNLGRLDATLSIGIHAYPFNLATTDAPDLAKTIARSYRVAPCFEAAFHGFLAAVLHDMPALSREQSNRGMNPS